jgi:putative flippase GtrA
MTLAPEPRRFLAFNLVGVVTTAVGIPLMAVFDALGVPYPVYTGLNYLLGIAVGFGLNLRFTFVDRPPARGATLGRYLVTFLSLLALVQGLQFALIDLARWPRWTPVALGMVVYGGLGYLVSNRWVFGQAKPVFSK